MSILPILVGLLFFLGGKDKLSSVLGSIDVASILELAKQFGFGSFLENIPQEVIDNLLQGKFDIKTLLPILIKFFTNKQEKATPSPDNNYDMSFMNGEIKTALYNYLKA